MLFRSFAHIPFYQTYTKHLEMKVWQKKKHILLSQVLTTESTLSHDLISIMHILSSCLFCSFVDLSDTFTVLYYMTLSLTSAILLPLFLPRLFQSGFIAVNNLMEFPTRCSHPHLAPSSSTDNPLISFPFLPACLIQLPKYFKRKCP